METPDAILGKQRKLNKLERQLALQKIKQRKADLRRKIELGELVIRAKLDQYSNEVILNALIQVSQSIQIIECDKKDV